MSWMTEYGKGHLQQHAMQSISSMARQHPVRFLLIGLVSGYLANRLASRGERSQAQKQH